MEIVGIYTGDGKSGRHIVLNSTWAERPTVVEVFAETAPTRGNRVTCTEDMWPGRSVDSSGCCLEDAIISLDPDGFTLGAHPSVNADTYTYHFMARLPVPDEVDENTLFRPNRQWLRQQLDSFDESWGSDRKGKFLECIAGRLFSWTRGLEGGSPKLTSTAQIDWVVTNEIPLNYYIHWGEEWLVEARNRKKRVGAAAVRDFKDKVRSCGSHTGVLFTRKGITGQGDQAAAGEIHKAARPPDNICIVVLNFDDLSSIADGCNFLTMLRQKRDEVRDARDA